MKTIRLGALIVLLGVLAVGMPTATAAQLPVKAASLMSFNGPSACTTLTLSVQSTNTFFNLFTTTVSILGVPPACRGLPFELTAYSAGGTRQATSQTPTTLSGTATSAVTLDGWVALTGNNKITGIALIINQRGIPTTWLG
jgi:hypothetical protein